MKGGRTNRRGRFARRLRVPTLPAGRYRIRVRVGSVTRSVRLRVTAGRDRAQAFVTCADFYLDAETGNDSNPGTSPQAAWRTLARASEAPLAAGQCLVLKRGSSFAGKLELSRSGTGNAPITISSYGSGPLPRIGGRCVDLTGSHVVVREIHVEGCDWAGIDVRGDNDVVEQSVIARNVAGVFVHEQASGTRILGNTVRDNDRMSVLTPGGNDDSGAFGLLVQGDDTEIARNTISGSDAFSHDYVRDGAAVEIYGARRTHVHHNLGLQNDAFTELGDSRSVDNTFAYNVVRSTLEHSIFLVTRGAKDGFGPIRGTALYNNTVYLTGALSEGFVCHAGCGPDILRMRNNIVRATKKAGYADAGFDEDHDLFAGGQTQFPIGAHTVVDDPGFVDAGAGDLRLRAGSAAIDRGAAVGYDRDFDGAVAPRDGNGDGVAAFDLGAFEHRR